MRQRKLSNVRRYFDIFDSYSDWMLADSLLASLLPRNTESFAGWLLGKCFIFMPCDTQNYPVLVRKRGFHSHFLYVFSIYSLSIPLFLSFSYLSNMNFLISFDFSTPLMIKGKKERQRERMRASKLCVCACVCVCVCKASFSVLNSLGSCFHNCFPAPVTFGEKLNIFFSHMED
jgi:hypothetical protein